MTFAMGGVPHSGPQQIIISITGIQETISMAFVLQSILIPNSSLSVFIWTGKLIYLFAMWTSEPEQTPRKLLKKNNQLGFCIFFFPPFNSLGLNISYISIEWEEISD